MGGTFHEWQLSLLCGGQHRVESVSREGSRRPQLPHLAASPGCSEEEVLASPHTGVRVDEEGVLASPHTRVQVDEEGVLASPHTHEQVDEEGVIASPHTREQVEQEGFIA